MKVPRWLVIFTLVACFVSFVECGLKKEEHDDDDGQHHGEHDGSRRKMDIKVDKSKVEIKAGEKHRGDGEIVKDKFFFYLETAEGGRIRAHLKYYSKAEDQDEKFGLRFKIHTFVEYVESEDGEDGFEPGVDEEIRKISSNAEWNDFEDNTDNSADPIVYEFSAETSDNDDVISVTGFISESVAELDAHPGIELNPDSAEIVIGIRNWNFDDQRESRLAILARVATKQEIDQDDGKVMLDVDENMFAKLLWAETAVCDGEDVDVIASQHERVDIKDDGDGKDDKNFQIIFSFLADTQPSECTWDPLMSFNSPASAIHTNLIFLVGVAILRVFV